MFPPENGTGMDNCLFKQPTPTGQFDKCRDCMGPNITGLLLIGTLTALSGWWNLDFGVLQTLQPKPTMDVPA